MPATVSLRHVTKQYQLGDGSVLKAADDVSLDIRGGSRTALVGPSGSGKSTLLHLIGAIDTVDDGSILVDGVDITTLKGNQVADHRAKMGFVFQQFHLIGSLSILDNVLAPLSGRHGRSKREHETRARDLLAAVGLSGRERALPSQLSGGQQQRVAIARALISQPGLLLADEPTGNLDSASAAGILELLAALHEEMGTTIILATHDAGVAATCDTVVEVRDGRVRLREAERPAHGLAPNEHSEASTTTPADAG